MGLMRNWESVCKWIYSTYLDNVKSQAKNYTANAAVGKEMYVADKFYIYDEAAEEKHSIATGAYQAGVTYYNRKVKEDGSIAFENAFVVNDEKNVYKANKFYYTL